MYARGKDKRSTVWKFSRSLFKRTSEAKIHRNRFKFQFSLFKVSRQIWYSLFKASSSALPELQRTLGCQRFCREFWVSENLLLSGKHEIPLLLCLNIQLFLLTLYLHLFSLQATVSCLASVFIIKQKLNKRLLIVKITLKMNNQP